MSARAGIFCMVTRLFFQKKRNKNQLMWYGENVKEINNKSHLLIMKLFFFIICGNFCLDLCRALGTQRLTRFFTTKRDKEKCKRIKGNWFTSHFVHTDYVLNA